MISHSSSSNVANARPLPRRFVLVALVAFVGLAATPMNSNGDHRAAIHKKANSLGVRSVKFESPTIVIPLEHHIPTTENVETLDIRDFEWLGIKAVLPATLQGSIGHRVSMEELWGYAPPVTLGLALDQDINEIDLATLADDQPTGTDQTIWQADYAPFAVALTEIELNVSAPNAVASNFDEGDVGFEEGDMALTSVTADAFTHVEDAARRILSMAPQPGPIEVCVPSGPVSDGVDNPLAESVCNSLLSVPTAVPAVTEQISSASTPTIVDQLRYGPMLTNADTLRWTFTFSAGVMQVDTSDFEVTGTPALGSNVKLEVQAGETSDTWQVLVYGSSLADYNGDVTLSVSKDQKILDIAGARLENLDPTGQHEDTYTVDNLAPSLEITGIVSAVAGAVTATLKFKEGVVGFTAEDVTAENAILTNFKNVIPGLSWSVRVSPQSSGSFSVSVADSVATDSAGTYNTGASVLSEYQIGGSATTDSLALIAIAGSLGDVDLWWYSYFLPLSRWYGVYLDDGGRVTALSLVDRGFSGTIPTELTALSKLESLWLSGNALTGGIPSELGDLSNLKSLWLHGNQLTGAIPPELGNLANLESLKVDDNQLTGAIPPELGALSNLQYLSLSGNQLTGTIPAELGSLTNLEVLWLNNNALTGAMPAALGNLSNLRSLHLINNALSGAIPSELGRLDNLRSLLLSRNDLTGAIPTQLGDLVYMEDLWMGGNRLSGAIPAELGTLTNLKTLLLSRNGFSDALPPTLNALSNLKVLWLHNNDLVDLPDLTGLDSLTHVTVASNRLTFEDVEQQSHFNGTGSVTVQEGLPSVRASALVDIDHIVGAVHGRTRQLISSRLLGQENSTNLDTLALTALLPGDEELTVELAELQGQSQQSQPKSFFYAPQDSLVTKEKIETSRVVLSAKVGGSEKVYKWFKDGAVLADEKADSLVLVPGDFASTYHCEVTSPKAPDLTLHCTPAGPWSHAVSLASIQRSDSLTNPTNADTLVWMVEFSETVLQVDETDFVVTGFADTEHAVSPVDVELGDNEPPGAHYQVQVWGDNLVALNDTVSIAIASTNNITSATSGVLSSTEPTGLNEDWFAVDNVAPTLAIEDIAPIVAGAVTATLVFSEGVVDFTKEDVTAEGAALTDFENVVPGLEWSVQVIPGSGTFNVSVADSAVTDSAGNYNPSAFAKATYRDSNHRMSDSLALVALYNATDGSDWTNNTGWLTGTLDTWHGVSVNSAGRVTRIDLGSNKLTGALPAELGILTSLEYLDLIGNGLTGAIPPELGALASLEYLDLYNNDLTGSIPSELGALPNLRNFTIGMNALTGEIPPDLSALSNLEHLFVFDNKLTGEIPPELGLLHNLQRLNLGGNALSGNIPKELAALDSLQYLYLYNNDLNGEIPPELGGLDSLRSLHLFNNDLSGSIPSELGNLLKLERLSLYGNNLTGAIPAELGGLAELQFLYLFDNDLSGAIPKRLGGLSKLRALAVHNNELTGTIPSELGELSDLDHLNLRGNQLTGAIPSELGRLSDLEYLSLYDNQLSGTIPPKLGDLSKLQYLYLFDNDLEGTIPSELGNLSSLVGLALHSNDLTGAVPQELGNLAILEVLSLSGNALDGAVPNSITSLTDLNYLLLHGNRFVNLPDLSTMSGLDHVNVSSNRLTFNHVEQQSHFNDGDDLYEPGGQPYVRTSEVAGINATASPIHERERQRVLSRMMGREDDPNLDVLALTDLWPGDHELTLELQGQSDASQSRSFLYAPQDSVGTQITVEDARTVLSVDVGGSANTYQWIKDGTALTGETASSLALGSGDLASLYYCEIKSVKAPDLTLYSTQAGPWNSDALAVLSVERGDTLTNPTNADTLVWAIVFSEAVQEVKPEDIDVTGLVGEKLKVSQQTGASYRIEVWDGNLAALNDTVSIEVALTNDIKSLTDEVLSSTEPTGTNDNWFVVDNARPSLDITGLESIALGPVAARLEFTEEVIGFTEEDVKADNATLTNFSNVVPGLVWSVHVTPGSGSFTVSAIDSAATDSAGNYSLAASVPGTYQGTHSRMSDSLALDALVGRTRDYVFAPIPEWFTGPLDTWYGVTLDDEGRVKMVKLPNFYLKGPIPPELGALSKLEYLDLGDNQLTGTIPPELGALSKLEYLYLGGNNLSGAIPPELGTLSNLFMLRLDGNTLSGSIPPELGNLSNLYDMALDGNELTGEIPPEFGNLSGIVWLSLGRNHLTGAIPKGLAKLPYLSYLLLDNNDLTGPIPPELGALSNLRILNLAGNSLTGAFPLELVDLPKLWDLRLNDNRLVDLPNLTGMPYLYRVDVSSNRLTFDHVEQHSHWNRSSGVSESRGQPLLHMPAVDSGDTVRVEGIGARHLMSSHLLVQKGRANLDTLVVDDLLSIEKKRASELAGLRGQPEQLLTRSFRYAPQDSVDTYVKVEGSRTVLSVDVGGSANVYRWHRNKSNYPLPGERADSLVLRPSDLESAYNSRITSPKAPHLTLHSKVITPSSSVPFVVSIVSKQANASSMSQDTLRWEVTFSETVKRVDAEDFVVRGSRDVTPLVQVQSGSTYSVKISRSQLLLAGDTIRLAIAATHDIASHSDVLLGSTVPRGKKEHSYVLSRRNAVFDALPARAKAEALPERDALDANYPNPFRERTILPFALAKEAHVRLIVYDLLGREVERVIDEQLAAGRYKAGFDGSHLAPGVYVYSVEIGLFRTARTMIVSR